MLTIFFSWSHSVYTVISRLCFFVRQLLYYFTFYIVNCVQQQLWFDSCFSKSMINWLIGLSWQKSIIWCSMIWPTYGRSACSKLTWMTTLLCSIFCFQGIIICMWIFCKSYNEGICSLLTYFVFGVYFSHNEVIWQMTLVVRSPTLGCHEVSPGQ